MITSVKRMSALILACLLCSCASVPKGPEWKYEKDAIHLYLKSDRQLNLYQGNPHTLVLCVYQLPNPNAFNRIVNEGEGMSRLLECDRFDPEVITSKMLVIQPDKEVNELLDRAEGTQYVAIVAGYYTLHSERVTRLYQIPLSKRRWGLLNRKKVIEPDVLNVYLYLGPQEILSTRGEQ